MKEEIFIITEEVIEECLAECLADQALRNAVSTFQVLMAFVMFS